MISAAATGMKAGGGGEVETWQQTPAGAHATVFVAMSSSLFAALVSLAVDAAPPPLPVPYLPWMAANPPSPPLVCMWNACLAVVVHAVSTCNVHSSMAFHMPVFTRALGACVDAVIVIGSAKGESSEGRKRSLWQMEACVHVLAAIPGVITAAAAQGDVDDDKMIAVCRVMEEWMCDDSACAALVWLFALPSAGSASPPSPPPQLPSSPHPPSLHSRSVIASFLCHATMCLHLSTPLVQISYSVTRV